jgi:glucose/mannose-6-phosphate isomerase
MPIDLDSLSLISKNDPSQMLGAVDGFPEHFLVQSNEEPTGISQRRSRISSLVVMGMGGSASAGDVVLNWIRDEIRIPALVHREPSIPSWVNSNTLFVAVSYSGNTLETLSAFREARKRKSRLVGIGNGGELPDLCRRFDAEFVKVEAALAPRAALGQMIVAASSVLGAFGLIHSASEELTAAGRRLRRIRSSLRKESPFVRNPAKRFASQLLGYFPSLYSLQRMSSVSRRFKNQLAENSKTLSKYDLLPESGHNEVVAWRNRGESDLPVIIRDKNESTFERSVMRAFSQTISSGSSHKPLEVRLQGSDRLSRLLEPIFFLDYVSVYLSILKGVDPTPTVQIGQYKKRLGA